MDIISFVATNAVEGVIGGAASVWPVIGVSACFQIIQVYLSLRLNYGQTRAAYVAQYAILSIILGIAGGIVGGISSDNYDDSIYSGIGYGALSSLLMSIFGSIVIYRNTPI